MRIFYECNPIRDLRVIPAANIITRACLAPCFLDGMSRFHTIPRRFQVWQRQFQGGKVDKAVPCGEESKLYDLNVWAMTFSRAKERTVSVPDELAARQARKKGKQGSARWVTPHTTPSRSESGLVPVYSFFKHH